MGVRGRTRSNWIGSKRSSPRGSPICGGRGGTRRAETQGVEVEKQPGWEERRGLLVPAVQDRVLQTAVAAHIEPFLEKEFDDCSFAYRRGRSVRMAVERVYRCYNEG